MSYVRILLDESDSSRTIIVDVLVMCSVYVSNAPYTAYVLLDVRSVYAVIIDSSWCDPTKVRSDRHIDRYLCRHGM